MPSARTQIALALAVLLIPSAAHSQDRVETFENGQNPDGWEIVAGAVVRPTDGNPGGCLFVEDLSLSTLICDELAIQPLGFGSPFSQGGDWAATGIERVAVDLRIAVGPSSVVGELGLILRSGSCSVRTSFTGAGPSQSATWRTFEFDVPSTSATLPTGWTLGAFSNCGSMTPDQAWASVITNVEEVIFSLDADPSQSCAITQWRLLVDNIAVRTATSLEGANVCAPLPNSTGRVGALLADGDERVAEQRVMLAAVDVPPSVPGYFVLGDVAVPPVTPPGSEGSLCIGGTVGRAIATLQDTGALGYAEFSVDLSALPTAMGAVAVQPGDTWVFQFWHRDVGATGASSNFTDALALTFT